MPIKPKFCSQCAAPVETRVVDGQPRDVCSACGAVSFQNPLPVVAAVVLNDRREVLLVKRKCGSAPEATWALPMGLVETDDSIPEAAARELKGQTGIDARTIRLLDTDLCKTDEYGDVLMVTFEMEKRGGLETPGREVDQLAYFPLSSHPALACSSHERALRICADMHLEDWAIRDSFERLQTDDAKVMLSDALVAMIKARAGEITRVWIADICEDPTTARYRNVDQKQLFERGTTALSQFSRWLSGREADQEVSDFYFEIGRQRKAEGFDAHEVLSALMLLKKHTWSFARNHGVWERPIDVYRVLELNRRIAAFFDRAMYHAARGFAIDEAN